MQLWRGFERAELGRLAHEVLGRGQVPDHVAAPSSGQVGVSHVDRAAVAGVPGRATDDLPGHGEPDPDAGAEVEEREVVVGLAGARPELRDDGRVDVLLEDDWKPGRLREGV